MSQTDTQNSVLVGSAAVAAFVAQLKQHPAPQQLISTGLQLAGEAVQALSPTSTAMPWLSLASEVFAEFFPPATPAQ